MFNKNKIAFVLLSTIALNVVSTQPAKADAVDDLANTLTNSIMDSIFGKKKQQQAPQVQQTTNVIGAPVSTPTQVEVPVQTEEVKVQEPVVTAPTSTVAKPAQLGPEQSAWNARLQSTYASLVSDLYNSCDGIEEKYLELNYSDKFYNNLQPIVKDSLRASEGSAEIAIYNTMKKMHKIYPTIDLDVLLYVSDAMILEIGGDYYSHEEILEVSTNGSIYSLAESFGKI
jgi:hypothetical protein